MDTAQQVDTRFATKEDAPMIADMSRRTFYNTFAAHNSQANMDKFMNEVFTYDRLVDEVGTPSNIFIVAEIDGQPAGYARLRESVAPQLLGELPSIEIARIYAEQSMIGKGIGQALMKKCIGIAYEMGKRLIWLGVWEKNVRAISFYEKWGFEKFDEHNFVLGDDVQRDWLMKKRLEGGS